MGSDFAYRQLKDCATWYSGGTPRKSSPEFWNGDIPWISAKSLSGTFIATSEDKVTELGAKNGTRLLPKDSILFVVRGMSLKSEFRVGITTQEVTFNQDLKALVANDDIDPYFLMYTLKSKTHEILGLVEEAGHGTGVLPTPVIQQLEIPVPSLSTQKAIAKAILNFDNKITLNRQISQTLELMAQTLFKSWFVDFDPVMDNALDAGNSIPDELQHRAEARKAVRESEGFKPLPDDVRQLFPDAFEESELGWVPKGWVMKSVSNALTVNPKVKLSKGQSAHFVDMKALPTSGYSIEEITHKAFSGGAKFEQNDVLLARITPCLQNGKTGFVNFLGADEVGFGSTEFIVLRGDKDIHHTYIACLARHEKFRQHTMQSMVGSSGRQRVQNSCFDDYFIAVPTGAVMKKFAQMTQPSFDKFKANTAESIALAELRDTLLPKLISGELRLDDVEAAVEQETVSA